MLMLPRTHPQSPHHGIAMLALISALAGLLLGCDATATTGSAADATTTTGADTTTATAPDVSPAGCLDGDLRLCQCADGQEGRRLCADGQFGACVCPTAADAAATDAGCVDAADCPDDGDKCNGVPTCEAGACVVKPASVVVCAAGTVCAARTCDPASGACKLTPRPDGTPCADGNPCTVEDSCKAGSCKAGVASFCQCEQDSDCAAKEDGDPCTGSLICNTAQFPYTCITKPGSVVTCDPSKDTTCSKNTCDPTTGGCAQQAVGVALTCDDGDACTVADSCKDGACIGKPGACDCQKDADCAPLEDGDLCNGTLRCDTSKPGAFTCVIDKSTVVTCDTSKDSTCTKTLCAPKSGVCLPTALTATSCDDGDICTAGDTCKGGACTPGIKTCECTTDSDCKAKEDGDLCNGTLFCDKSKPGLHVCKIDPKTVVTCDTSGDSACKKSVCAAKTGTCALAAVANNTSCDDGVSCTEKDVCTAGSCKGSPTAACGPTWATVYQAAFAPEGCAGCHGDYNGAATTLATLKSGVYCGAPLVKPGDPAGSSIVAKLVAGGSAGCGAKMPKGASGISAKGAKLLIDWIKAGAKP